LFPHALACVLVVVYAVLVTWPLVLTMDRIALPAEYSSIDHSDTLLHLQKIDESFGRLRAGHSPFVADGVDASQPQERTLEDTMQPCWRLDSFREILSINGHLYLGTLNSGVHSLGCSNLSDYPLSGIFPTEGAPLVNQRIVLPRVKSPKARVATPTASFNLSVLNFLTVSVARGTESMAPITR
jgi:hypothetical protein